MDSIKMTDQGVRAINKAIKSLLLKDGTSPWIFEAVDPVKILENARWELINKK